MILPSALDFLPGGGRYFVAERYSASVKGRKCAFTDSQMEDLHWGVRGRGRYFYLTGQMTAEELFRRMKTPPLLPQQEEKCNDLIKERVEDAEVTVKRCVCAPLLSTMA